MALRSEEHDTVPITRTGRPKAGRGLLATVVARVLSRRARADAPADAPEPAVPAEPAAPVAADAPRGGPANRPGDAARSGAVLVWTDCRVAPKTGSFAPNALPNGALRPAAVPTRQDGWERLNEFALTYDGYAYWENLPELAQRALASWTRDGSLPATIDECRGCLFYEQRRWHHFGDVPAGRSLDYFWALAGAVRAKLSDDAPVARAGAAEDAPSDPARGPQTDADGATWFVDDDAGFLAWLAAHPAGLVLNTERTPSARYLKLHRAACPTLAGATGKTWTVSYRRVCAGERAPLDAWAASEAGAAPDACKRCKP